MSKVWEFVFPGGWRKTLSRCLLILVLFVILLYFFQNRIIFFPDRLEKPPILPMIPDRVYENVQFTTTDGVTLCGIWIGSSPASAAASASPRPVVLYSHGNAGHVGHRVSHITALASLPVDILVYDYRGFGQSGGSPTVAGAVLDAEAALKFVTETKGVPLNRVVLFGVSLGTGITMALAEPRLDKIGGIVLESGMASLHHRARSRFWLAGPLILTHDLPSTTTLARYHGPLLVTHSKDDEVIPFADGEALFAACPSEKKTFLQLESCRHNDPIYRLPHYLAAWREFLGRLP